MSDGAADNENEHRDHGDSAAKHASAPESADVQHDDAPPTEAMSLEDIAAASGVLSSPEPPPLVEPPTRPPLARAMPAVDLTTQPMTQQDLEDAAEPPEEGPATQPMSRRELAESLSAEEATEVMRRPPIPQPVAKKPVGENTSAIDSLFGEGHFVEYEDQSLLPSIAPLVAPLREPKKILQTPPGGGLSHSQKVLLWVAGVLVAVLAIIALFLLGTRIGQRAEVAAPTPTPTSTPTPTAAPADGAPAVAPGIYGWQALAGGECLQPFTSVWAETFTVVDCTTDHTGQLIARGQLPDASGAAYPGAPALQASIAKTCSTPTVLNFEALQTVADTQVTASFPPTEESWNSGDRWYYCFVSRKGGGLLPGDLKVAAG
ncbi:septum formation family protein [Glaciihabitans sp. dw_435]|uniref:septum formation family protein n=1 Tax=Glaciihabitans sp. dw_435 TaxID=2720081 RepID=UPI001BD2AB6D|nr:septum formation family protein [Glaciihabitans sp. dw_435]